MRFFHFVEEDHGIRATAHSFSELSSCLIADVSRRSTDQTTDRVLLHVFTHVDANHRVFTVKQLCCQGLRQFGFADTGGTEEQETGDRSVGITEPGT